jgi:hypothetical protein
MALETLEITLEDEVWAAVQTYCARHDITPDQLVSDHLRSLTDLPPDPAGEAKQASD